MISYAQNFEDVLLFRCFGKLPDGFYVDIGAFDPVIDSVTKAFYDQGWSGINVEPGPRIEDLRRDRPRDINLAIAISVAEGEADFWEHTDGPGTSTLCADIAAQVAEVAGERIRHRVPTLTLAQLLSRHAPDRHIHFLKIDAEGSEEAIIAGGDWQRFRPEVLVVESTEILTNRRIEAAWHETLRQASYTFAYFDGVNDFWVRAESEGLRACFAYPVNTLDNFQRFSPELENLKLDLARVRKTATGAETALATAREELANANKEFTHTLEALTHAKEDVADASSRCQAAEAALRETRRELETSQFRAADVERDAAALKAELVSMRQAGADLEAWRRRLLVKLKAREAPLELRLTLPLARALRLVLPSSPLPETPLGVTGGVTPVAAPDKRKRRRKLKKRLKRAKKRAAGWLKSAVRGTAVGVARQMAKRSPRLLAKIRSDVRKKIDGTGPLPPSAVAVAQAQAIEDALLTLALHDAAPSAGGTPLPRSQAGER